MKQVSFAASVPATQSVDYEGLEDICFSQKRAAPDVSDDDDFVTPPSRPKQKRAKVCPIVTDTPPASDDESGDAFVARAPVRANINPLRMLASASMYQPSATTTTSTIDPPTVNHPLCHKGSKKQSCSWVMTFFKGVVNEEWLHMYDKEIIEPNIASGIFEYAARSLEIAPTTGKKHVHVYLRFPSNARRNFIATLHDGWFPWFEAAKGTPSQCVDYFKFMDPPHNTIANATFKEFGVFPNAEAALVSGNKKGGKKAGAVVAARWNAVRDHLKAGQALLALEDSQIMICHYKTLESIRFAYSATAVPSTIATLENYWIVGATGIGKSRFAHEFCASKGAYYVKNPTNKWWCQYDFEPVVLIDDIGRSGITATELKIWGDHYKFNAEYKGGSMIIRPKIVVVTSNYSLSELYPDPQDLPPLLRRFKVCTIVKGKLHHIVNQDLVLGLPSPGSLFVPTQIATD